MASGLKEYRRKRNFSKTREPSGKKVRGRARKKLIFVVQEHHATRLHYDFRLEMEGVLKSWAVPKGPSLDPADKRLAVQTEDHPLGYAKFHGSIPKGEYGGGEVFIWDNGTWEMAKDEDPMEAMERGHLEFILRGKRLKGKFILVRTKYKGSESKKNWLLIKRHDEVEALNDEKWPGFIPPQLPRSVTVPPEAGEWVHELKFDGYRMQAHIRNGIVHLYTRKGLDWSNSFPFILEALGKLPLENAILDGEIARLNEKGRPDFQQLQNSIREKDDGDLRYYLFDILHLNGEDLRALPLLERKGILEKILKGKGGNLIYSEHFMEKGKDFYAVSCEHQLEGVVSKLADSPYVSGRGDFWVKCKCGARQEFVIGGWSEPKGKRAGIGALLLGVYEGNDLRYVGRVGTGFDETALRRLKKELAPLSIEESPFDVKSPRSDGVHWVSPEKVCEVSFAEWTDEGLLRQAVFLGARKDKAPSEIIRERPEVRSPALSSPDKILFKREKITKKGVADFYQQISSHMLPYMEGRPLSLVRCPAGALGGCFFQKHVKGDAAESLHTFVVREGKNEGTYLTIDSSVGLTELVQMNAFEIHAWNCRWRDYLRPDQLVMDFDPGVGVPWRQVVEGAFELREMLEALGLISFVKLTGGKGLHVHVPLAPVYTWEQVKSFAHGLALEFVSRHPEGYTANMSKKTRKKKIFVDYLRNGFGATAVVPYSLRARPVSACALPVEWEELRRIKSSHEFTLKRALSKIKRRKRDPWEGMLAFQQKIPILQEQKRAA